MAISGVFSRASRATILFVEDDDDTRFVYESLARDEGYDVALATDGHEAIAVACAVLPDLIVLDLVMPGLDGIEVARHLRASPLTRPIPILVVSADTSIKVNAAVRASGCDGHLVKPCSADDLLGMMARLIKRRRAEGPAIVSTLPLRPRARGVI